LFGIFAVLLAALLRAGPIDGAAASGAVQDMFRTIVGFCCGLALHRLHSHWGGRIDLYRGFADGLALAAAAVLFWCLIEGDASWLLHLAIVVTCFPALIVAAIHGRMVRWVLTLPPLVYLGTISYSIYLVHFPLQLALHLASVAFLIQMPYGSAAFMMGFFLAVIGLASITYYSIEVPGKKLLRRRSTALFAAPLGRPLESGSRK